MIVILTTLGGFAIYAWGWRGHRVDVTREVLAHEPGQTARTVRCPRRVRVAKSGASGPLAILRRHGPPYAGSSARSRSSGCAATASRFEPGSIRSRTTGWSARSRPRRSSASGSAHSRLRVCLATAFWFRRESIAYVLSLCRLQTRRLRASAQASRHARRQRMVADRAAHGPRRPGGEPTGFGADLVNRIAAFYAVPRVKWVDAYRAPLAARSADFEVNDLVDKGSARLPVQHPLPGQQPRPPRTDELACGGRSEALHGCEAQDRGS